MDRFRMPGGELFQFTVGRAVDMNRQIHVEGKGVVPAVRVRYRGNAFLPRDVVLDAAVAYLNEAPDAMFGLGVATVRRRRTAWRAAAHPRKAK